MNWAKCSDVSGGWDLLRLSFWKAEYDHCWQVFWGLLFFSSGQGGSSDSPLQPHVASALKQTGALGVGGKVLGGCRGLCEERPGVAPCRTQLVPEGSKGPTMGHNWVCHPFMPLAASLMGLSPAVIIRGWERAVEWSQASESKRSVFCLGVLILFCFVSILFANTQTSSCVYIRIKNWQ